MSTNRESARLRIELDTEGVELSPGEIAMLEKKIEPLHALAAEFPISDLYITITFHERTNSYHTNLALVLTGQTLATATTTDSVLSGIDACVAKMVRRILQYKAQLGDTAERDKYRKGTQHDVVPAAEPNLEAIRAAHRADDYLAFRQEMYPYEDSLDQRIGRWTERFPTLQNELGVRWTLSDFLEEVFLVAFDQFDQWPEQVRLGQWLENLIPVALKMIAKNPDEEMSNIEFVRSALEAETETREG